jgi:hypothetical protein
MACVFIPVLSVILLHSIVYDSWRHLFFIYPSFILISARGFISLKNFLNEKAQPALRKILMAITAAYLAYITFAMIILHPYQNVYFNFLAGNPSGKFEIDYWGLSCRGGIEYILKDDKSNTITISGSDAPVELSIQMIPKQERERIHYTDYPQFADYYLEFFRSPSNVPAGNKKIIYSVIHSGTAIMSVSKTSWDNIFFEPLLVSSNDFEKKYSHWIEGNTIDVGQQAHSGNYVCEVDGVNEFSDVFSIAVDSLSHGMKNIYVKASVWKYFPDADMTALLVITIDKPDGGNFFFRKIVPLGREYDDKEKGWKKIMLETKLPDDISATDILKVYVRKPTGTKMYIDDFNVELLHLNYIN